MTIDSTSFLERYPMFSELAVSVIDHELSLSSLHFSAEKVASEQVRDQLIGLLTAHVFTLEYKDQLKYFNWLRLTEEGEKLPDTKETVRSPSYYSLTIYGQRLRQLLANLFGLVMFVN